jgi:short-subunit dehydrogenase
MSNYNVSKAALVPQSETLHLELCDDNINVCRLCPVFLKLILAVVYVPNYPTWKIMGKCFDKSPINASQVTDITFKGENNKQFWLLTQSQGKHHYHLERLIPLRWYFNLRLKQTYRLRQRLKEEQA